MGKKFNRIRLHGYKKFRLKDLLEKKAKNKQNIILCFPAIKRENSKVLSYELEIAGSLLKKGFLDVVAVAYDGDENDSIAKAAEKAGALVVFTRTIGLPDMKKGASGTRGKGTNMRKFAYFAVKNLFKGNLKNNLVGFLDADISPKAFGSHYILGLFGPLVSNPSKTRLVKLVYRRPKGFGRVNKILCHPLVSVFSHPRIEALQSIPYITSGEVAMDGELLSKLKFTGNYGVEVYTLLQFVLEERLGPSKLELTNVGFFDHKHQTLNNLRLMSFGILRIFLRTLQEYGLLSFGKGTSISNVYKNAGVSPPGYKIRYIKKKLDEKIYKPLKEII